VSEFGNNNCEKFEAIDSPSYPLMSRNKQALLVNLLSLPQYAWSAAASWSQQPAAVANAGTRYAAKKDVVKRAYINEMALLSGDWDAVSKDIAMGMGAFTSYIQPHLFDDEDSGLIDEMQPHVLMAKAARGDADNPTYTQAMNSPDADKWADCMRVELETLEGINAWSLVRRKDIPPSHKILPMKWAFKLKRYPDGLAKKFKARFCVRGDRQVEGRDYFETWAPVVQWPTVRAMIILRQPNKSSAQHKLTSPPLSYMPHSSHTSTSTSSKPKVSCVAHLVNTSTN
jgi:hypothetical protein